MNQFLSCDWGTTSFRLRLIDAATLKIVAAVESDQGIAAMHRQWIDLGKPGREVFYNTYIRQQVSALGLSVNTELNSLPVILSGMASSSIGLIDIPYKKMPFKLDGSDLQISTLISTDNPLVIVSGACSANDVMRGEETKVIGCAKWLKCDNSEQKLLLPGTHSKHVTVRGNIAIDFKTYMTGEFFDMLSTKSILAASVIESIDLQLPENRKAFLAGIEKGIEFNLLNACFLVRTNQVLRQMQPYQNYFFLSGLLIGGELGDVPSGTGIYLVSGEKHLPLYRLACDALNIEVLREIDADGALIAGQALIFENYEQQY